MAKLKKYNCGDWRKILAFKRGSRKEEWISTETWKAIDDKKLLKSKVEQRRIGWNSQKQKTREYREKDKEVKKEMPRG